MATSGVITNLDTARDIITDALRELQIYGSNKVPSASDIELGRRRLNWMLKEWQDDGWTGWRVFEDTQVFAIGEYEKDLTPRVGDVLEARLTASGYDRPLARIEYGDFVSYPNKAQTGAPTIFVPRPGLTTYALRIWPVPLVSTTITYTAARVSDDVTSETETLDVPQQYTRCVMMNLAAILAPSFGRANDPNAIVTIREAARLYQLMRAADRPASYFMRSARWP